jgi:hypothetical protein
MLVGDAKLVVEAVLANKPDWSTKGHIIEATKKLANPFLSALENDTCYQGGQPDYSCTSKNGGHTRH